MGIGLGSLVVLKSGGPVMTVVGNCPGPDLRCAWFTEPGQLDGGPWVFHECTVAVAALKMSGDN